MKTAGATIMIFTTLALAAALAAPPAPAALAAPPAPAALAAPPAPAGILLVFAHPDDEIVAAPLIARHARAGVPVTLALVTPGDQGAPADGSIAAGPDLARTRTAEAACSARALGITPPRILGFGDGTLGMPGRPSGQRLATVAAALATLIGEIDPRVIVTWGADGGYGHPDHRLTSAVVTQVVQQLPPARRPALFYVGFPADHLAAHPPRAFAWTGTDRGLLTDRVAFGPVDAAAMRTAALCHQSQYRSVAEVDFGLAEMAGIMAGAVHLRPALGTQARFQALTASQPRSPR